MEYATTDQLRRQSKNLDVLANKVAELSRAQQESNETANQLVAKIASMMEVLGHSQQQLGTEARLQAERTRNHDESLQYVRGLQELWWNHSEVLADGQTRHQAELWNQHQRIQGINQRQEQAQSSMPNDQNTSHNNQERRRSAPNIHINAEPMPPPRRVTVPEYGMPAPSSVVYSQISDHPNFDENRYEDWKKAIRWRQEINAGTDSNRLLATLGMSAKGSIEIVLQEYFDLTRMNRQARSIEAFVSMMDEKFRRPTEELILLRVEQWNEMKKKQPEGFKSYWIRLERLQQKLIDLGIVWPIKVAFQKAFASLCMSKEQQTLVRAALEMTQESDSLRELKRITIKLFDNQVQETNDVCVAMESSAEEEDEDAAAEWELQNARSKVVKNRGGNLQKSIKSTQNLYGFKGNSKGSGRPDNNTTCRNCGSNGHWWRNCPNLLKKPVIFNRAKGASKKGGKKEWRHGFEQ